jgi:nitronate monooxygenase
MSSDFLARLGVAHPIVQAPMAGGPTTPELVAAVSNAGALGSLGAAYLSGAAIRAAVAAVRERTARPFSINLFIPERAAPDLGRVEAAQAILAPYRAELGIPTPPLPSPLIVPFEEQIEATLDARPALLSFAMGTLDPKWVRAFHERGTLIAGTATTVAEARILEGAGVDAIVAQGSEAGGHRGTFAAPWDRSLVGTMALVPQIVDAVRIPVIAAGGIMDGRGIAAALALGAAAAQLGTAFLTCAEAGTDAVFRRALAESTDESTTVTTVFSGKAARGLRNRFSEELAPRAAEIPPFPLQNVLTRDIRNAAAKRGEGGLTSQWAGQASAMVRSMTAGELVAALVGELAETKARLAL